MESRGAELAETKQTVNCWKTTVFLKVCSALRTYLVWRIECWPSCLYVGFYLVGKSCSLFLSCPGAKEEEAGYQ